MHLFSEFTYPQVFRVWEVIWAASSLVTTHFHLFFALAMIIAYRHIIIDNRMDFTDVIKFYNGLQNNFKLFYQH